MKFAGGLLLFVALAGTLRSHGQSLIELLPEKSIVPKIEENKCEEIRPQDTLLQLGNLEIISKDNDTPARTVQINLNEVEGAALYEVHIYPARKIWNDPWKFTVTNEESSVRLRLSPGRYAVRTRSLNEKKHPGSWSDIKYFWVQFRPIKDIFPAPKAEIEPKGKEVETLVFEWPRVPKAQWYFFRLKDKLGRLLRMALTKQTYLKSELKVNSEYRWSVMPLSHQDEYKALLTQNELAIYNEFTVLSAPDNTRGTLVKVGAVKLAFKYQFEVVKIKKDGSIGEPSIFDSYEPQMRFRLPPSQYEARVRTFNGDNTVSEWSSPFRFFIQRNPPASLAPLANEVVESTDDMASKVTLKWQEDSEAASYAAYVFNDNGQMIHQIRTEDTELEVRLPHNARYKWIVKSYSKREPASTTTPVPDETAHAFSINEYIKLELSAAEESSQNYGWLRHISSVAEYEGRNYDNNAIVRQTLFTGEGQVAGGYWSRKNKIGLMGHGSLAGFLLRGQNYTYTNYGLHGGYRKILDNGARLRLWLGVTYQELPEILTHPFTNNVVMQKVKTVGPQMQVSYLQQINQAFGWQAYTSAYYSSKGLGSPNGLEQNPTWSYRFGLLGVYSSGKEDKWMVGYTYKVDTVSYGTTDPVNLPNTAVLVGHYLSLTYEFAFEKSLK